MTDRTHASLSSSIAGSLQRFGAAFQLLQVSGRVSAGVERAEMDGLVTAFRARSIVIAVVSIWLLLSIDWPRNVYYVGLASGFFVLGWLPYRLCHHSQAERIKLVFILLDVILITVVILVPPPGHLSIDWPVQTRLRNQTFLLLLLMLGEAALTYSPRRVVWTGVSIALVWLAGTSVIYHLPDTLRFRDVAASAIGRPSDAALLRMFGEPTYVSLASWSTQMVATALMTGLLALAVARSRRVLLSEARAEVVRSDLSRYVSPDLADAVSDHAATGFGEPQTREVAVLFADIVAFTGFAETLPPENAFALLRSFQERSARVVVGHRGTIDKYLGDGLMATFGALREEPDAAARAIACAFALCDEVERWNLKRGARGSVPVKLAIGVHGGSCMVGNLGSEQRIEFTVVGDVVNVTSRLEKATRELGCRIAVSDTCLEAAGSQDLAERFERTVEIPLRGRRVPLRVHLAGVG